MATREIQVDDFRNGKPRTITLSEEDYRRLMNDERVDMRPYLGVPIAEEAEESEAAE